MLKAIKRILDDLDADLKADFLKLLNTPPIFLGSTTLRKYGQSHYIKVNPDVAKLLGDNVFHVIVVPNYVDLTKIIDVSKLEALKL